ncbi:MAG: FAD-binding protein [Pseudomonadota bacterium]
MGNVLIVAEQVGGELRSASLNAITFGKKQSEVGGGGDVVALLIGDSVGKAAAELAKYGVSKVMTAENAKLGNYMAETYAPIVVQVAKAIGAEVVGATATNFGKDLLPRVAGLLEAGMASDVYEIAGPKNYKSPMVAGNVLCKVEIPTPVAVVSVRQTEWIAAEATGTAAPVEAVSVGEINSLGAEIIKIETVKSERPELTEAKVVVSGGRGMKSSDNFKHIEALADLFGGAVGATRAACDGGMVPNDLQVGQTGKVVAPDLYIAVALSGAIQHLAGMKSSKVIVAINKDPEAPIFEVADYGLVAKWEDTLEELTGKLRGVKG